MATLLFCAMAVVFGVIAIKALTAPIWWVVMAVFLVGYLFIFTKYGCLT